MDVQVMEMGNRPRLMTKARRFAPAGCAILGEKLGERDWADYAFVILDWENVTKQQPDEIAKPVAFVQVHKVLPQYEKRNHLVVETRLDIEDIFGGDTMTAESILDIAESLRQKVEEQVERRKREES